MCHPKHDSLECDRCDDTVCMACCIIVCRRCGAEKGSPALCRECGFETASWLYCVECGRQEITEAAAVKLGIIAAQLARGETPQWPPSRSFIEEAIYA